jgi:SAM-dependent methyltransferase
VPRASALEAANGADLHEVCASVEAYYAAKLAQYGATPLGVDWSCTATQWLRFVQLLKVCRFDTAFSLIDLGCGYGALAAFLADRHPDTKIEYLGLDLSSAMVRRARRLHRGKPHIRFAVGRTCPGRADYVVASGVMNVMLGYPLSVWEGFVRAMLVDMDRMSRLGFAVNFMRKPTPGAPDGQLYCPSPEPWVRFCEEGLGRSVELRSDYGMREFTLLARTAAAGR